MFALKKILGHLLMPLPLGLGLITLGLLLLLLRRRVCGWGLLLLGWLVLAVASNRAVSIALTASLEKTYPPVPTLVALPPVESAPSSPDSVAPAVTGFAAPEVLRGVGFVAVLGSGHGNALDLPAGLRLSDSARSRLAEGLRIALALPDSWLIVCGPAIASVGTPGSAGVSHARMLADTAVGLGFPRDRIVELDTARDTAEEIEALRLLVGDERLALVTSAWHLPRTMKLAATAGLAAHPCPADYLGGRDATLPPLARMTWDAESLNNSTRAWREYVGQAWVGLVAWWRK